MTSPRGPFTVATIGRNLPALVLAALTSLALFSGGAGSTKLPLLIVAGLALLAAVVWLGLPQRRLLIGLLFFVAPFDISKAFVAPLEQFYSPGLYVTIGEATAVALGLIWAIERVWVQKLPLPCTALDCWAFGFLGLVWIGALHAKQGALAYASAASYSLCVIGFYVVSHALQSRSELRLALKMVVAGFSFEAIYVAAQMSTHSFLTLPGAKVAPVGTQGLTYEAEQISAFRPIGTFDHPNALADYLTLLLPGALALLLMTRKRLPRHVYNTAAFALAVGTALLLLTLSRGGWVACGMGMLLVGSIFWRKRIIGSGHVLALGALLVAGVFATVTVFPQIVLRLTEPDARSVESRIVLTDQAITIIRSHPLMGVGYGGYNRAAFEHIPPSFALISAEYRKQLLQLIVHNHYLLLAAELGLPAMLYWIYLMLRFIRQTWPLSRWRDPGSFALAVGLSGALTSQMIYLSSDNYYTDIRVFLLWLTAGVLQAMTQIVGGGPGSGAMQPA